jgi:hypothetical protein
VKFVIDWSRLRTQAFVEYDSTNAVQCTEALPGVLIALACVARRLNNQVFSNNAEVGSSVAIDIGNLHAERLWD